MITIALIGGNSQVATEVALFLTTMPGVKVVAICRSALGSAFLRHCGVSCRVGDVAAASARQILAGADLVADFSLPSGGARMIKRKTGATVRNLVHESTAECRLVYISTQMAFGIRMSDNHRKRRLFSRTVYGATKRYGEKLAMRLARAAKKEMYVLRLGQVHGELQSVSQKLRKTFAESPLVFLPDTNSDTVFAYTIAEALANIATGKEKPGVYTLVSTPEWHWKDIYEYYCALGNREQPELQLYPCLPTSTWRRWLETIRAEMRSALLDYRELLSAYILVRLPGMEEKITARYRCSNAARDVSRLTAVQPIVSCCPIIGPVPGARLASISDSRLTMAGPRNRVLAILSRAAEDLVTQTNAIA
jgi:nucleoside-diphosphate-sugar epimerase